MAPERLSREEKKSLTRQALLNAAAVLVARHGVDATTLDRIAGHAGLTKGAVYSNFSGKEELLLALVDAAGGVEVQIQDAIDGTAPLAEQLADLGTLVATKGRTVSRTVWRLHHELFQLAQRNPGVKARKVVVDQAARDEGGRYLDDIAARRGEALPLAGAELVTVLSALAIGLVQQQAMDPDSVPDELFARAFGLLAGGLQQPPDRPRLVQR